jgi:hypothetical protein
MLTRPQAIGLTIALAVTAVVLLPAGLIAFWRRRVRQEEAEAERQRLELLEALGLPLPPMGDEGAGRGKGKAAERLSATSSIRPSWRMYLCRGKALTEEEIMGRSKVMARPTLTVHPGRQNEEAPRRADKGKGKARETTTRSNGGGGDGDGESGAQVEPPMASTSRAGRLMSKFSTDSESPARR